MGIRDHRRTSPTRAAAPHWRPSRSTSRTTDRVHESRALAIQPRTLEVLANVGVTDQLISAGNPAVQLRMHVRHRVLSVPLFDLGLEDTAYPYLLFLSQAETERLLNEHLATVSVTVERGVELVDLRCTADTAVARLRHRDGREEETLGRGLLTVHHLAAEEAPAVLHDPYGTAVRRLGLTPRDRALFLVRPDG
ncbi:MAG TPA: FAD-dependent monooxygenase, partial [Micromonospora sp.]|nr:FAD-dependent monooxygenase [Micromonospora sp.]